MKKTIRVIVKGKVQGVFYRASTQEEARKLGLKGWVRNLPNGDVEFVASGDEDKLKELIDWAHKGPPLAKVREVIVEEIQTDEEFSDFEVRYF